MAGAEEKFRFLTMDEFGRLSQAEKLAYLERAADRIRTGRASKPERSLFKDGPRNPPRPRKKQP